MATPSLTAIANKYGTDKGTEGPFAWPGNNYTDVYEAYLWPMREEPLRLLEIGLGVRGPAWTAHIAQGKNAAGGASIKMWEEYFPHASIFGIDVNPSEHLQNDRVRTSVVDQGDAGALGAFVAAAGNEPFDLIVDDGSHRADHQQISFGVLFEHLRPGGLYIVEDLMANGFDDPGDHGRFTSTRRVRSTRRVFSEWAPSGAFGTPHAIGDDDHGAEVDWVHFHCPAKRTEPKLTFHPRHPIRLESKFLPGSDALCVVRRRP